MSLIVQSGGQPQALSGSVTFDSISVVISSSQVLFAPDGFINATVIIIDPVANALTVSLAAGKSWETKTVVNANIERTFTLTGLTGGSYDIAPGTLVTLFYSPLSGAWTLAAGTSIPGGSNASIRTLNFVIDGAGVAIAAGLKGYLIVPFVASIQGWQIVADIAGDIVIDIWKLNANRPLVGNTITAAAKPTLAAGVYAASDVLTGWTTAVAAGDVFAFNVDSAATLTQVTIGLTLAAT